MDTELDIVTLEQIQDARSYLRLSPDVVQTPLLKHVQKLFLKIDDGKLSESNCDVMNDARVRQVDLASIDLYMKMENMQTTGTFKIRGVVNQMRQVRKKHGHNRNLVTMSAGNYGKAFAHCVGREEAKSVCIMPVTASQNRVYVIENLGVQVKQVARSELDLEVDKLVKEEGYLYCHSFNDVDLIAGYASSALELLEEVPDPDVVVVNCGGGGFISGIAAAISLSGVKDCRVYAVEPEGAPTMYKSFKAGRAMSVSTVKTVAAGLAPLYSGSICYKHCQRFVEDVLLVSDKEILRAMKQMFDRGIKAEPSGSAALAAVLSGKIPDIEGKKVVVYVTGSNVTCEEMNQYLLEMY